jgi:DNA (cytosine-5)-methyltransferase 1
MPLTLGSLFRGIGGFDRGFEDAGVEVRWSVEIDEQCNAVARRHWPHVPIVKDVREAGSHNLEPVDIIAFGSPCQDFSLAGKRKGLEGERSGLFYQAGRVIRLLHPRLAVWENVPGVFSSYTPTDAPPEHLPLGSEWEVEEESDFATVLAEMEKCGALDIAWRCFDSQWFAVAQRRRRVFLVADFGARRASEILALAEGMSGHPAPRRETGQGVAGTLESRVGGGGFPGTDGACAGHVVPAITSKWAKGYGGPSGDECQNLVFTVQSNDGGAHKRADRPNGGLYVKRTDTALTVGTTDQTLVVPAVCGTLKACAGSGTPNGAEEASRLIPMPVAFQPRLARNGRGGPSDVAYPLTAEAGTASDSSNAVAIPAWGVRRLTPLECERLQGFPDRWTAWGLDATGKRVEMSDTARYRMLGNAVTRTVAHWIGKRIVKAMHRQEIQA